MFHRSVIALLVAAAVALLALVSCAQARELVSGFADRPPPDELSDYRRAVSALKANSPSRAYMLKSRDFEQARVVSVVSGDTIVVELDGETLTVGYVGLDAPVIDHPTRGTEPYALEARQRNADLVEGKDVLLEQEAVERDINGRHMRYVYVDDLMVNGVLVFEGRAPLESRQERPVYRHAELLFQLQNMAIVKRRGGWETNWLNLAPRR